MIARSNFFSFWLFSPVLHSYAALALSGSLLERLRCCQAPSNFTSPIWGVTGSWRNINMAMDASAVPPSSEAARALRRPVYFLSHGGPNVMYETSHPAYAQLAKIGREITSSGTSSSIPNGDGSESTNEQPPKLKAVVVFSAHWQAREPDTIEINTAEKTDLIYDFYGFPAHYYAEKFPNVGSEEVALRVKGLLEDAGIKVRPVKRGLDHGVWASFKCAFPPDKNPLNVPIVQVSLYKTEDAAQHYQLGQALSSLRDEGIQIIVSGMAVHNLRDMMMSMLGPSEDSVLPYTASFDEALRDAVAVPPGSTTSPTAERKKRMLALLKRPDLRQAHPTLEHLLPVYIGAGTARDDEPVDRVWTYKEGSLSWAMYRFGKPLG